MDREITLTQLRLCRGDISVAAREYGMHRKTLESRIRNLGLADEVRGIRQSAFWGTEDLTWEVWERLGRDWRRTSDHLGVS